MYKLREILKIGDKIVIGMLSISIVLSFFVYRVLQTQGRIVSISVDGREAYQLSLGVNREVIVQGPLGETCIRIENGNVYVSRAPCPQKICMKMGKISRSGEVIICIPNKILVRVENGEKPKLDGITL